MAYICSYCVEEVFTAPSEILLLNHIRLVHSCDPNFNIQCSSEWCSRTFTNFRTFQNHRRMCYADPSPEPNVSDDHSEAASCCLSEDQSVTGNIPSFSAADLQAYSAKWVLKTSETRFLTRTATLGIVHDVTDLLEFITELLKEQTRDVLYQNGVDDSIVCEVEGVFSGFSVRPFEKLTSFHQQLQYYREHLGFIEPRRIVLKESSTLRQCGRRRKIVVKKTEMMYVPLLETLQSQLNNAAIFHEVTSNHNDAFPQLLGDYCDGNHYKHHPLFSTNASSLQIILYYDELELCNPLGSRRKKHKIGAFYYLLGNMCPRLRSKISTIQLLLLVKYESVVEFGIEAVLHPIIEDIRKLESDEGVSFTVNGEAMNFRGTVTIVSADNPASALLGGFKQSASAFRYCRHCTGTSLDVQSKFTEAGYRLRSTGEHSRQCTLLEQDDLSSADRQHYSTTFGVNRQASLHTLRFFDVTSGALIPDIMHDILEGALPLEVKLMLRVFVLEKKLFTLQFVDESLKKINLRIFDGDKPSPLSGLSLTSTDSNLHQHAMQMWTLGRFLPLAIGHVIPEETEQWENFIRLLDIMDILFSRCIPVEECGYLESLISDHHLCFKQLYPEASITMKMHSMIHMPRLMYEFGPLINHWTTRFEAKHKYFKHLANVMGNYTNICYSLALRHQLQHCYLSLNKETLPGEENDIGPGQTIPCPCSTLWGSYSVQLSVTSVYRANWVRVFGTKYQTPFAIVIGKDDDILQFGSVENIFVDRGVVLFEFIPLITHEYLHHYHAYAVKLPNVSSRAKYLIMQSEILDYHSYGLYCSPTVSEDTNVQYVVLRSSVYTSDD